jgi:hypothetical protein
MIEKLELPWSHSFKEAEIIAITFMKENIF